MTIYIVRKHPRHPYSTFGFTAAFTIDSTFATRKEAQAVVKKKNSNPNTSLLYTVGKVALK